MTIVVGDILLSMCTLLICAYAIHESFTGAMGYLTALIGIYNVATGYVLGEYMHKSKAENTKGGIVYDTTLYSRHDVDM